MKIADYKELIRNLPVREQSFTTKRTTWANRGAVTVLENCFSNNEKKITISRQDILAETNLRKLICLTVCWGYPRGMRGNHAGNIFKRIEDIEQVLDVLQQQKNIGAKEFKSYQEKLMSIEGLGMSTYSKLLYFTGIVVEDCPCLILDRRLIEVFRTERFEDFDALKKIPFYGGNKKYVEYLRLMKKLSADLETEGEKVEEFLFLFGGNLQEKIRN